MQRNTKTAGEYDSQIAKGNEAAALLSNGLLNQILDKMEADATHAMISPLKIDEGDLMRAWQKVKAIGDFKQALKTIATTGQIASKKKATLKGE